MELRSYEIAFMVSVVFTLPAAGADYTLDIFGNANMDDTIDVQDVVYVKGIIYGSEKPTDFADANYDGAIDEKDIDQIEAIIEGSESELVLMDSAGRLVRVKKPLQKVATCSRHFLEVAQSLKIPEETIVAISDEVIDEDYSVLFPRWQDKIVMGCTGNPSAEIDCESILSADPELVILYASFDSSEPAQENLVAAGVNVIRFNFNRPDLDNLFQKEVTKVGYLFDKKEEAKELLSFYKKYETLVQDRLADVPEEEMPKVYYESFTNPYVTFNQFARVETTGGKNIIPTRGIEKTMGVMNVDPEQIVAENPDVIIKMASRNVHAGYHFDAQDTGDLAAIRDEILGRPELQNVNAVKNGNVYVISGFVMQSGPCSGCKYFLQDLYQAKWFHPELFEDIDPKAVHQEYLKQFQGLDLDLDQMGVFVYPVA
ncbi:MAG: Periplasmic binding protein [Methanosaeta sp. PtaB.Bin087]|nr:MAG: Periplasmic binding protein [Methanosaeta sp. PtaB.Bin087]